MLIPGGYAIFIVHKDDEIRRFLLMLGPGCHKKAGGLCSVVGRSEFPFAKNWSFHHTNFIFAQRLRPCSNITVCSPGHSNFALREEVLSFWHTQGSNVIIEITLLNHAGDFCNPTCI